MTVVAQPAPGGYDVIVVGTGPAGVTVARKLESLTDSRILLVESGAETPGAAQELAEVEAKGDLPSGYFSRHSQRAFGGTSNIWVGWCAVLDERPFLDDEWPLAYAELYRYYAEAARILNVPPIVHERPEAPLDGTEGNVVYRPWYFSNPVRFGWQGELGGGARPGNWARHSTTVDVLLGHTATRLATRDGVVEGVSLAPSNADAADATSMHVAAGRIVLACGGIQNARLLLLSLDTRGRQALPALGRNLADHPHLQQLARLEIDKATVESVMDTSRPEPRGASASRPNGVNGVVHGIGLSSSFSSRHFLRSATVEFRASPAQALLAGRRRAAFASPAFVRAEMAPKESNRVELSSTQTDFLGQPRARVAVKFDVAAVMHALRALNAQLVRAGIGRLRFSDREPGFAHGARPRIFGGGHLMGTTRMGKDASRSVTDDAGKVHGFSNLYVAGSSLFPAASAANPTLTIVALALRLAEHLATQAR